MRKFCKSMLTVNRVGVKWCNINKNYFTLISICKMFDKKTDNISHKILTNQHFYNKISTNIRIAYIERTCLKRWCIYCFAHLFRSGFHSLWCLSALFRDLLLRRIRARREKATPTFLSTAFSAEERKRALTRMFPTGALLPVILCKSWETGESNVGMLLSARSQATGTEPVSFMLSLPVQRLITASLTLSSITTHVTAEHIPSLWLRAGAKRMRTDISKRLTLSVIPSAETQ